MDHNIVFHIVNMITFLSLSGGFIYLMVKVNYISRLLTDKLLNDTNHKLLEMMYKRMRSVGILTNAEKALHAYMKKKVAIIYTGYKEAKKNPNVINNPTFFNSIIQEGLTFITSSYSYPTEFIETLEKINKTCFEQFKNDYSFDAATVNTKKEKQAKLIHHLFGAVETSITQIIATFERTKSLIKDPDFLAVYPNYHTSTILKENVSTEYIDFTSNISIKFNKIKELIASGDAGLMKAIELLISFTHSDSVINNELLNLSARLNNIEADARKGIVTDETEDVKKSRVRDALLSIMDTLNN